MWGAAGESTGEAIARFASGAPIGTPFGGRAGGRIRRRASSRVLQRFGDEDVVKRGEEVGEIAETAPIEGANLWQLSGPDGASLYLLGTMHGKLLHKMSKVAGVLRWLHETKFDGVFAELERSAADIDAAAIVREAKDLADARAAQVQTSNTKFVIKKSGKFLEEAGKLDDVYTALAAKGGPIAGLETQQTRDEVRESYQSSKENKKERRYGDTKELGVSLFGLPESIEPDQQDLAAELSLASQGALDKFDEFDDAMDYQRQVVANFPEEMKQNSRRDRRAMAQVEEMVVSGNEKQLMTMHSKHLQQGFDVQDIEARNEQWTGGVAPEDYAGRTVLWVVGVSHLAGLMVNLRKQGWKATSFLPAS